MRTSETDKQVNLTSYINFEASNFRRVTSWFSQFLVNHKTQDNNPNEKRKINLIYEIIDIDVFFAKDEENGKNGGRTETTGTKVNEGRGQPVRRRHFIHTTTGERKRGKRSEERQKDVDRKGKGQDGGNSLL